VTTAVTSIGDPPRAVEVAAHAGLLVCGVLVGLAAALVSRMVWRPSDVAVPWGLVLALTGSVAVVWLAGAWRRTAAFAAAAGWVVGVAAIVPGGPGGDLVIINDMYGNAFLLAGLVAVVAAAGWGGWRR